MATPLTEIINNIITNGGDGARANYVDSDLITFGTGTGATPIEAALANLAFALWSDLIDVPVALGGGYEADITLDFGSIGANASGSTTPKIFGHVAISINRNVFGNDTTNSFDDPQAMFETFLHEIGHALGLRHPGSYNGDDGGQTPTYQSDAGYPEDSEQYTVMSYFPEYETGASHGAGGASTPLLHDIAAIQSLYGANYATRSGDTVYGFGSNNLRSFGGFLFDPYNFATQPEGIGFAIWDGGGIDTIDASQFVLHLTAGDTFPDQVIDLREGEFSDIGFGGHKNVAIAFGVVIENAFGGGGSDVVRGNGAANHLVGNGGNDRVVGNGGNDTLEGGAGNDTMFGGDASGVGSGNDYIDIGSGSNEVYAGDGSDTIIAAQGGVDIIDGGDGYDVVSYEGVSAGVRHVFYTTGVPIQAASSTIASFDVYFGIEEYLLTEEMDVFEGTDGAERIVAAGGTDYLIGLAGDDSLLGGSGDDTLLGGEGSDSLDGGANADSLVGGAGDDQMIGGGLGTADTMIGGSGNDTYFVDALGDVVTESAFAVIGQTPGIDLVVSTIDYTLGANVENLTLSGFAALSGTGNGLVNTITGNSAANTIDGGASADVMRGRGGNDIYIVDNVGDLVDETTGNSSDVDTVRSSVTFSLANASQALGAIENLTLLGTAIGGTGNDLDNVVIGNGSANILNGNGGADTLEGALGADTLLGGTGNDTYRYSASSGADRIMESGGIDTILLTSLTRLTSSARSGNDLVLTLNTGTVTITNHFTTGTVEFLNQNGKSVVLATGLVGADAPGLITGTNGNDVMDGNGGDDLLFGNKGKDELYGDTGNDTLNGGQGQDTLDGGAGDDLLTGGEGRDTFVFSRGYGHDTITDFRAFEDRLDLGGVGRPVGISYSGTTLTLDFGGGDLLSFEEPEGAWRSHLFEHAESSHSWHL